MGLGDWLMASGQARTVNERSGQRVCITDASGSPQWSEVFENNPRISRTLGPRIRRLNNAPGCRPYIQQKTRQRWYWQPWDIQPGELYFTEAEIDFAEAYRGFVLIEPNTKVPDGNKAWFPERWQAVADVAPERFVQVGAGLVRLRGVRQVATTFRQAAAILSVCRAYVGPEGALHHAAAAVGTPAVVLFSEFIGPDITGYPTHRNLRHAGPACGARTPCPGCRASMAAITVDEVVGNLLEVLQ